MKQQAKIYPYLDAKWDLIPAMFSLKEYTVNLFQNKI